MTRARPNNCARLRARVRPLGWACALALAGASCGEPRCRDGACRTAADEMAAAPQARMRSARYRIELDVGALAGDEARSQHYRVRVALDATRLGAKR